MIPERVILARRKLSEGLPDFGSFLPDDDSEPVQKFNNEWLRYVTGETELSNLRAAFGRLRKEAYRLAREEWKRELTKGD